MATPKPLEIIEFFISDDDAVALYLRDEKSNWPSDSFNQFVDRLITARPEKVNLLKLGRFTKHIEGKPINSFRIWLRFIDRYLGLKEEFKEDGTAETLAKAKNIAATKIIIKLEEKGFNLYQPERVIGVPNYRGHCYYIAAFVALINAPEFNKKLKTLAEIVSTKAHQRDFTFKFYSFCMKYLNASRHGEMTLTSAPTGLYKKSEKYKLWQKFEILPRRPGKKPCLELDKKMTNTVAMLSNVRSQRYSSPGGKPAEIYADILDVIDYELAEIGIRSPFIKSNIMTLKVLYNCEACSPDKTLGKTLTIPSIRLKAYAKEQRSLQTVFYDAREMLVNLLPCYTPLPNHLLCLEKVEDICMIYFTELPELIFIDFIGHFDESKIPEGFVRAYSLPDIIKVPLADSEEYYKKYAVSIAVKTEQGGHTWVCLRDHQGLWHEINNNFVIPKRETIDVDIAGGSSFAIYRNCNNIDNKHNWPRFY